ncbi:hypothetical protein CS006_05870 [Bifidobacterium primatium]|uniref:Uncharacterized protein n=1 Tax=Bifidobacterium primatium TaxID=2045438 RepID=A0A2M9H9Q5_9BIFI|nr:hypothetical protein CS006_05870 [Bifidobacterium primatium]
MASVLAIIVVVALAVSFILNRGASVQQIADDCEISVNHEGDIDFAYSVWDSDLKNKKGQCILEHYPNGGPDADQDTGKVTQGKTTYEWTITSNGYVHLVVSEN